MFWTSRMWMIHYFVAITSYQAFCKLYDIWQLASIIQLFLFSFYKLIYKNKLVNSLQGDSNVSILAAKILFIAPNKGLYGPL